MKKINFRKVLGVLLATTMVFSLTACSGSNKPAESSKAGGASEKKVIKLFHRFPDEPFNSFIEKTIAEYETMNPDIDIVITSAQNDPYKEKLKVVVGGDECPDIFFSWCGEFSERFLRENLIMDLTDAINSDAEWKDSLLQSQMENYTKDGVIYGVPFRLDAKMFFYNKQIFDEQGLKAPETWDDFIQVCEKLKAAGITPISYGNKELWPSAHYIGTLNQLLVSNDVRKVDYEPKTGAFTDPGYVKALDYYAEILKYCNDSVNGLPYDISRNAFCQGKTAMQYAELIEIPYMNEANPDLQIGMFNFPYIEGVGDKTILTGAPEGFVVSSKTKYPKECLAFLKWFLGPEVGAKQAQEIGWFNASKGVVEGVDNPTLVEAYNVITSAEKMGPWFDNVLYSTVCDEFLTAVSDFTNGDITSSEVMAKVQSKAKEAQSLAAQSKSK
ncbi:ABC transporter substrate-binding protein [Oscillospiraceae bacterium PP1C4]